MSVWEGRRIEREKRRKKRRYLVIFQGVLFLTFARLSLNKSHAQVRGTGHITQGDRKIPLAYALSTVQNLSG